MGEQKDFVREAPSYNNGHAWCEWRESAPLTTPDSLLLRKIRVWCLLTDTLRNFDE